MTKQLKSTNRFGVPRSINKTRIGVTIGLILAAIGSYFGLSDFNALLTNNPEMSISYHQEIALGLQAKPNLIERHGGLHPNEALQNRIDDIGAKLVQNSFAGTKAWEYDFHVLADANTINAFALPGGQIFITQAFLDILETEGQLAGVLGHQTGHVITRHATKQMVQAGQTEQLVAALSAGPNQLNTASVSALNAQFAGLIYSRDDEIESDYFGIRVMSEAGYDPRSMMDVMKILNAIGQPAFFQTHPNPEDRIDSIREIIPVLYPAGVPDGLIP